MPVVFRRRTVPTLCVTQTNCGNWYWVASGRAIAVACAARIPRREQRTSPCLGHCPNTVFVLTRLGWKLARMRAFFLDAGLLLKPEADAQDVTRGHRLI